MLSERQALGHSAVFWAVPTDPLVVNPVIVLRKGSSAARQEQMFRVRDLLAEHVPAVPLVAIYEVSILRDFTQLGAKRTRPT